MVDVLKVLINASEKAACIARSCCNGASDEVLLVAEKGEGEANARFDKDFKTIADVLAQESAKSEIGVHSPKLAQNTRGEECSEIGGIYIKLQETSEKTAELLSSLVTPSVAKRMSEAAHTPVTLSLDLPKNLEPIDVNDLGVWIDPIDATGEFISGVRGQANAGCGLPCVTVLIGAYLISTGEPVMGVINQPFYNNGKGRIIWGVNYASTKEWGTTETKSVAHSNIVLMSSAENLDVVNKLKKADLEVKSVPGAGHKLLKVALGEAGIYIVSKGTTFRWDTCAPHSILRAMGGDIVSFNTHTPITYNDPEDVETQQYCNFGGIIAYSDPKVFENIKSILV
ncbi:inositol polyphosphate 1-phosphatase [Galleria mellonella]|uniref:Inositol polyphosphate 1-phosphatase n=1 Tax=Galleria mellonella TaxID=7137 RepID=A0A6J1WKX4_GALME|nr:inositol polyphosphate 1-phosphatase [Galleria mellonella]